KLQQNLQKELKQQKLQKNHQNQQLMKYCSNIFQGTLFSLHTFKKYLRKQT
ncbi:hypothetical protein TVAGG3_0136900, partial [Trichomonas vaginalis G3]|uniref:hypothetical protein n=1 Tax=Trichomonas vaginalis (strain ATCC PRA-98 / G3) TaxID=412133 RepID=UPI0021E5AF1B